MQEGITIARRLGDLTISSFSLAFHGDIALQQGDLARAERIYKESTDVLRSIGNILFTAYPLRRLGYLALMRNEISYVLENFKESLAINVEGGDHRGVAACLTGFAALALHLEKPVLAARLLGAVDNQLESRARTICFTWIKLKLERVRGQRACLDQATFAAALAEGWNLTEDQAINLLGEVWEERNLVMR